MLKSPLSKESEVLVFNPTIDFFLDRIKTRSFFSYAKQNHGFWDVILGVMIVYPELRKIQNNDEYFMRFSHAMSEVLSSISTIYMEPKMYYDILKILNKMDEMPSNFFYGVSDLDFYPQSTPPHSVNSYIPTFSTFKRLKTNCTLKCRDLRLGDRQQIIKNFLPKDFTPFNGILWRSYGFHGDLDQFFQKVKDNHQIIIVGPEYYKDFGKLLSIDNFHHIPIDQFGASAKREELLNRILEHNKSIENQDAIYFFVASSLSLWLMSHLHTKMANSYLIDVGQALDFVLPSKKVKIVSEFQLQGFEKGDKKKKYKTEESDYFFDDPNGDKIIVTEDKEVVFLDAKRNMIKCFISSFQVKFLYLIYYKIKIFKYTEYKFVHFAIKLMHKLNYLLRTK